MQEYNSETSIWHGKASETAGWMPIVPFQIGKRALPDSLSGPRARKKNRYCINRFKRKFLSKIKKDNKVNKMKNYRKFVAKNGVQCF